MTTAPSIPPSTPSGSSPDDASRDPSVAKPPRLTLMDRIDAFISKLSMRSNFWHRVCSMIWMPYAFRSGIRMKRIDSDKFAAVLPFRRFNKNWYNAMAGAALLGNSEIAGGMYVFGVVGADYTVVCKHLEYKFLRPCFGPAMYKIRPQENIQALIDEGGEFDTTLTLDIVQQLRRPGEKDRRIGRANATFHVTPKALNKIKGRTTARGNTPKLDD